LRDTLPCCEEAGTRFCFAADNFSNREGPATEREGTASTGAIQAARITEIDGAVVQVFHYGEDFAERAGGDQEPADGAIRFDQFGAVWAAFRTGAFGPKDIQKI